MERQKSDIQRVFPFVVNGSSGEIDWVEEAAATQGEGAVEVLVTTQILRSRQEMLAFIEDSEYAPATIEDLLQNPHLAQDRAVAVLGSIPYIQECPRRVMAWKQTLRFVRDQDEKLFPNQGLLVRPMTIFGER